MFLLSLPCVVERIHANRDFVLKKYNKNIYMKLNIKERQQIDIICHFIFTNF